MKKIQNLDLTKLFKLIYNLINISTYLYLLVLKISIIDYIQVVILM